MTQEEKELLLKDLCARLPYGLFINTPSGRGHLIGATLSPFGHEIEVNINPTSSEKFSLNVCKPYLRPMSSMTDEERLELSRLTDDKFKFYLYTKKPEIICYEKYNYLEGLKVLDWLNKNMFDYRGLIPMNLALEASQDMYK